MLAGAAPSPTRTSRRSGTRSGDTPPSISATVSEAATARATLVPSSTFSAGRTRSEAPFAGSHRPRSGPAQTDSRSPVRRSYTSSHPLSDVSAIDNVKQQQQQRQAEATSSPNGSSTTRSPVATSEAPATKKASMADGAGPRRNGVRSPPSRRARSQSLPDAGVDDDEPDGPGDDVATSTAPGTGAASTQTRWLRRSPTFSDGEDGPPRQASQSVEGESEHRDEESPARDVPGQKRKRKSLHAAADDEDQEVDDDVERAESRDIRQDRAPRANLRRRRATQDAQEEDSVMQQGVDDEDGEASASNRPVSGFVSQAARMHARVSMRDTDGYLPGAIVRVKLQNFVTYDAVEFRPGPYLNMIIGANGTGKSTVVCAIALGLGWKPSVLGRAKDVQSYVKQGHQSGSIELELKGKRGQRNAVIRRIINKKSNSSEWFMNGKRATLKEINEVVEELEIQIGNLCSFLPQDKVADFAAMQPPELLRETQRAAGDSNLTDWHDRLIELGKKRSILTASLETEHDEVTNLEERNEVLRRDVRRYEERRRIEMQVEVLNLQVLFAQYNLVKRKYDEAKSARDARKRDLERLQRRNEPMRDALKEMEVHKNKLSQARKTLVKAIEKCVSELKRRSQRMDALDKEYDEASDKKGDVDRLERARTKIIAELKDQIRTLRVEVANEPPVVDTSELDARLRDLKQQERNIRHEQQDTRSALEEIKQQMRSLHDSKTETIKRLQSLDNVKTARLKNLQQSDPHAAEAVLWLRENAGLFEKKVFEPVMLEISLTDSRHAPAVESCINWNLMRTFVCQTRADYDLFTAEVIDRRKLRVNVSEYENAQPFDQLPRPVPVDQLGQLGFNDYIIDLIDGPGAVLTFLAHAAQLHTIPVAFQDRSVDVEAVEQRRLFKRYITGTINHTVSYSNYGNRLPQTLSRSVKEARTLTHSVNQSLKARLDAKMREIAANVAEVEREATRLQQVNDGFKARVAAVVEQMHGTEQERIDAQRLRKEWEKRRATLETKKRALHNEENKPSAEEESRRLTREVQRIALRMGEVATEMKGSMQQQLQLRGEHDELALKELQHEHKLQALKEVVADQLSRFKDAESALEDARERFARCKREATEAHQKAQASFDNAEPEIMEAFRDVEGDTPLEELEEALEAERAKLNLAHGVSANVIEAFKRREAEIKKLNLSVAAKRRDKEKLDAKITAVQEKWLPALHTLVENVSEKFSAAFERLGCAGEVRVSENEDFEKWGIDILVKFRDNEQLQLLSGQRQSGGERSLSTILYLMSLTELSRSPFSLVDEINQGMDQRAERAVHDQMVEVTCREDSSQYFLITPKLLPGLRFHERMKVLVINNGEWLPEAFNFTKYIQRRRAHAAPTAVRSQA